MRKYLQIFASARFLKSYRKGSVVVQHSAEHFVHDFVRTQRSNPTTFINRYDRVAGLRKRVLEFKIGGGDRLLAHYANKRLTLLNVGGHHIVSRYDERMLDQDLSDSTPALQQFFPERPTGFFLADPDDVVEPYGTEPYLDWVYFLDEEQEGGFVAIQNDIQALMSLLYDVGGRVFFIVGGPGTGKSCVLLNLLKYYVEEFFETGIVMSDQLADYIRSSTTTDIDRYRVDGAWSILDEQVLLVDDPHNSQNIKEYVGLLKNSNIKVLILAFDPLQLDDSLTDEKFQKLVETSDAKVLTLSSCYRQKKNVGRATKQAADVIAASTPFLAEDKIEKYRNERSYLTKLANDVSFKNPRGYAKIYEEATMANVRHEIKRVSRSRFNWQHWYSLLVVQPKNNALVPECYELFGELKTKLITLDEINYLKGLEFQHVFLFIYQDLYEQIEYGFEGSGQRTYNQRRLLRIPFSRAKDNLVTFVLETD